MKFLALKQNLSSPKSIYTISGEDEFLKSQALKILKEQLVTFFDEFNYIKVDMDITKVAEYENIINTMPFGDSYKLVVFSHPTADQVKAINQITKNLVERVIVVCIEPAGKVDNSENIDCNYLDRIDLNKWLNNYLAKANVKIEKKALDYILDMSAGDMAYLNSELPKLLAYVGENTISLDDVNQTFTKNKNYFVYNLSNAIDLRDKKAQFDILNSLTLAQNIGEIFTFLGSYFRRMFYCSISKQSDEQLAQILKIKPYAVTKARQYVAKNKASFYIKCYNKYINLDFSIKSGKITPQNAMYELLLDI